MNANGFLGSVCNLAGANSTEVKQCIKGYMDYQKMNRSTDSQMQQITDYDRTIIQHNQKLQNQNETKVWVESKAKLAGEMRTNDIIQRDWYNQYTNYNTHQMNNQLKYWKTYDHNPPPVQQTCGKWHDCIVIHKTLDGTLTGQQSKTELKPQFGNHTTGIINHHSQVNNWSDLQKWFEGKNQTKN